MKNLQEAVDALVQKGRLFGRLTHNEIIEALSGFDVGPDAFDEILERLVNESVEVVDDDVDVFLVQSEDSPAKASPGRIEFDASARELLKWATWIALCSGAQEVDSSHLVAASRADSPPPEPPKIWDIPFSPHMQSVLARACVEASPVHRNDLLISLGLRHTLGEAFGEKVRNLLQDRGVNTSALWRQLEDFEAYDCIPKPEFDNSATGRRWRKIVSEVGDRPLGQELGFLLFCILADKPPSAVLKNSGVTEDLVVSLLRKLPGADEAPPEISTDTPRIFPWEPLSVDSLRSLGLAWRFSDREQLRPDDLLPMLLTAGSQARRILEALDCLHYIFARIPTRVRLLQGSAPSPKLSPEMQTVLEIAREAAGDSPLDTGHLLLGLAEIGHPLVSQLKLQIKEALDGSL